MKQVNLTTVEAKAFFMELIRALEPVALADVISIDKLGDRSVIDAANIIWETVLRAEGKRLELGRKPRVGKNG